MHDEFLTRATDRANKLIARIFLYANIVCLVFLLAKYLNFFSMNYSFTLKCWAIVIVFSIALNYLVKSSRNRKLTRNIALLGVVSVISLLGTNNRIGVNITYAMPALFSCLYFNLQYTIFASAAGFLGLIVSLLIKSQQSYLTDLTSATPMEYFVPILGGFTIEYILIVITCLTITKILKHTIMELHERNQRITILQSKEIQTFADIVECRDKFSGEHIKRTSLYVDLLCHELVKKEKYNKILTEDIIRLIVEAAPLHDLGKIQIPDSILKKNGRLTEEEFAVMKTHSEIGYNMIEKYLTSIIDQELLMYSGMMALYHHEHFDGTGYPRGIEGEAIPLCARIMSVADVLDALLSKRQYKESFSLEKAIDIMKEGSGTMFDPEIIDCLLNIIPKVREINAPPELEELD